MEIKKLCSLGGIYQSLEQHHKKMRDYYVAKSLDTQASMHDSFLHETKKVRIVHEKNCKECAGDIK